jgi:hypothetical protein
MSSLKIFNRSNFTKHSSLHYDQLKLTLVSNSVSRKPHHIRNIDLTGISTNFPIILLLGVGWSF